MSRVIIGADPDSHKHGVAVRIGSELSSLHNLNTIELYEFLKSEFKVAIDRKEIRIHLENPKGNNSSAFSHRSGDPLGVKFKKSEGVGQVKHAQACIEQIAEKLNIPVKLFRNSSRWKKGPDKKQFERITGWKGRSNEETRSAAWFAMQN